MIEELSLTATESVLVWSTFTAGTAAAFGWALGKPRLGRYARTLRTAVRQRCGRMLLGYGTSTATRRAWEPDGGGVPIHRYYLEEFLREHGRGIRGHCLEFQEDSYTTRFGGDRVTKLDIIHLDDSVPGATIVADLTKPNQIADNQFDTIVCTFVLHCVTDFQAGLQDMHRILKPGGMLLGCVPCIHRYTPGYNDLWRFTPECLDRLLGEAFGNSQVSVRSYGNSLTAAADIRGLVARQFRKSELDAVDPLFPVTLAFCATKAAR